MPEFRLFVGPLQANVAREYAQEPRHRGSIYCRSSRAEPSELYPLFTPDIHTVEVGIPRVDDLNGPVLSCALGLDCANCVSCSGELVELFYGDDVAVHGGLLVSVIY